MLSAIKYLVFSLKKRGFLAAQVLAGSGLSEADIAVPWLPLLPDQFRAIVDNSVALTGDVGSGLQLGFDLNVADLGLAGFAALTSPTFGDARKTSLHLQLLLDPVIYVRYSCDSRGWLAALHEVFPLDEYLRFAVEFYLARSQRVITALTGARDVVREIGLSYPEPDNAADYAAGFACPVYFGQSSNWIVFDADLQRKPLPLANAETHRLLVRECEERLVHIDTTASLAKRVYLEIMRSRTHRNFPVLGIDELADRFCVSARTLRRRLAEENTTYQQIVDMIRKELAVNMLMSTSLSAKEIAYTLGYSSVNNFRRAFKAWTGNCISDFRAESEQAAGQTTAAVSNF